jgi:hypothetical protein
MCLKAGFAEIDITPPLGTHKIGWLRDIVPDRILDPLFARVAVFEGRGSRIAIVQLDTLFVAWPEVAAIREGVAAAYGFPGEQVMVAATHNHAGPAVTHAGDVDKDEAYAVDLVRKVILAFGRALEGRRKAEIGVESCFEWGVAHNRRVVMRDGTVRTHGTFDDPDAMCLEGPVDPELAVIAARGSDQKLLGAIVSFGCHPTHHGGDNAFSSGFPGVLARELEAAGCPVSLFLNGASGNIHTADPRAGGKGLSQEAAGKLLAHDVQGVIARMQWQDDLSLRAASRIVDLPYRGLDEREVTGRAVGAQRFIDPNIYERHIPALVEKIEQRGVHRAEVQVLGVGDWAIASVPGEFFCELGLQIKQNAYPVHALVATCANGRVGYLPTREAFVRGGYETTFGPSSMLAPEAGDQIVETATALLHDAAGA